MLNRKEEKGQGLLEYALLIVFIAIVIIAVLGFFGFSVFDLYEGSMAKLCTVFTCAIP